MDTHEAKLTIDSSATAGGAGMGMRSPAASAPTATTVKSKVDSAELPNGSAAAALLAAGIGCAALGIFALLGDAISWMAKFFTFYGPTGPLSGVTDSAIAVWLVSWFLLNNAWSKRDLNTTKITAAAFVLLGVGFALTFPPFMDLLQGK